jgi:hypothetical protein
MMAWAMAVHFVVAGCQGRAPVTALAARDDTIIFFGAGRERLDWGMVRPVPFEVGSWRLPVDAAGQALVAAAVSSTMAAVLAGGRRIVLVGVGDAGVPDEYGRQQALARALEVRRFMVERGADPERIHITGFSAEEMAGLNRSGHYGPRVELVVAQ